jgi:hypothetical protein
MAKKKKKLPKRPKMGSSLEVWKRWEKKAAEVKKFNDAIDRERDQKRKISQKY